MTYDFTNEMHVSIFIKLDSGAGYLDYMSA